MATILKQEALDHLKENPLLANEVCGYAKINPLYVVQAIMRKSTSLTTYKAVMAIAKSMGEKPENILEEKE